MTKQVSAPEGKVVHVTRGIATDAVYMALMEQLLAIKGPISIARLLAKRLRDPEPRPEVLAAVASLLDPYGDTSFMLVVVRRRRGKSRTKQVNDAALAKAVKKSMEAVGNKHGSQKKAVKKVAEQFEVAEATVRKALRSK